MIATYSSGFNIKALQGLLNILNADQHIYMYYGSGTRPPCIEDVFWIVFARPRSISVGQNEFLKNQLIKNVKSTNAVSTANSFKDLFGNNRIVQVRIEIELAL